MEIEDIKKHTWKSTWAGHWSILTCDYTLDQYYSILIPYLGIGFPSNIAIFKKGYITDYLTKKELDAFGNVMAEKVKNDPTLIKK